MDTIRNFSVIAHIDHGKSTLADRILERTHAVQGRDMRERYLDTLELEQEKGITIKLQTARMHWLYSGKQNQYRSHNIILNLIDTPGHVDFSYEVSRSIDASEGVILLVDASQGIQAQTISNYYKALDKDLIIIPAISKIDLAQAQVQKTKQDMIDILGFSEDEIILTSGKTGEGVEELLNAIVERIPPPKKPLSSELKLLVFDSFFHEHKGVIALVKVVQGELDENEALYSLQSKTRIDPVEIGYLLPSLKKEKHLFQGEVGYIATGMKEIQNVYVGETITHDREDSKKSVKALGGYKPPKPMIFASLYPTNSEEFSEFSENLKKLALNDAALQYTRENSPVLGSGFCCGFLGLLHLEITQERLSREFNTEVFTTTPSVLYKLKLTTKDTKKLSGISHFDSKGLLEVRTASEYPKQELIAESYEPWVVLEVISPQRYIGPIIELGTDNRGIYLTTEYLAPSSSRKVEEYVILRFEIPTSEIITKYFDKLKSLSQGYASMDYDFLEYRKTDIVKVSIVINHESVEALSFIAHKDYAPLHARMLVDKLKDVIPRQQFEVPIQAAIEGNIIARSDIRAYRKNVTEKLYGGDVTRKKKLLEKQKKGKKRMKQFGKVEIPKEAFLAVLKND